MENAKEIWKKIPGYGGVFYISDKGRVYRHGDKMKDTMLKPYLDRTIATIVLRTRKFKRVVSIPKLLDMAFGLEGEGKYYGYHDNNCANVSLANVYRTDKMQKNKAYLEETSFDDGSYNCVVTADGVDEYYQAKNEDELVEIVSEAGIDKLAVRHSFNNQGKAIVYRDGSQMYTVLVCRLRQGVK